MAGVKRALKPGFEGGAGSLAADPRELNELTNGQIFRPAPERNVITLEPSEINECLRSVLKRHFQLEDDQIAFDHPPVDGRLAAPLDRYRTGHLALVGVQRDRQILR